MENLKTYNMADFESGQMPKAVGEEKHEDGAGTGAMPRSADAAVEASAAADNRSDSDTTAAAAVLGLNKRELGASLNVWADDETSGSPFFE